MNIEKYAQELARACLKIHSSHLYAPLCGILARKCDIPPMSPLENVQVFFDAADEFYNK